MKHFLIIFIVFLVFLINVVFNTNCDSSNTQETCFQQSGKNKCFIKATISSQEQCDCIVLDGGLKDSSKDKFKTLFSHLGVTPSQVTINCSKSKFIQISTITSILIILIFL